MEELEPSCQLEANEMGKILLYNDGGCRAPTRRSASRAVATNIESAAAADKNNNNNNNFQFRLLVLLS